MENWIASEFTSINLKDERLNKRAKIILDKLGHAPARTIPQAFRTWKDIKACYRFFDNPAVTDNNILKPHMEKTIERIKNEPVVLLPTDNSILDYTPKKAMKGKGEVCHKRDGIFLHASLAVTPERLSLGVVDAKLWIRGVDYISQTEAHRDDLPIEEKESYRWLEGYKKSCEIARECPNTQIIYITDREGDIIELLGEAIKEKKSGKCADIIIRSQHDRQLDEKDPDGTLNKPYKKLIKTLKNTPALGELEFVIPPSQGKKGRTVKQQIKASSFTFRTKKYNGNPTCKVTINVVMAIEENPPAGESPLCWIFHTTMSINTFAEVRKVIEYYLCRWEVETFFKVLKSGCKIEERQLESTERMKPLIALFLILSWRIIYVMMLGRICPEMSSGDIFCEAEWKSVYKILNIKEKIPENPPTLNEFILMIAQLGGYVGGKKAPPPGVKVMWRGMARMVDFAIAWEAFGK